MYSTSYHHLRHLVYRRYHPPVDWAALVVGLLYASLLQALQCGSQTWIGGYHDCTGKTGKTITFKINRSMFDSYCRRNFIKLF